MIQAIMSSAKKEYCHLEGTMSLCRCNKRMITPENTPRYIPLQRLQMGNGSDPIWKEWEGIWWQTEYPMACSFPSNPGGVCVNQSHTITVESPRRTRLRTAKYFFVFAITVIIAACLTGDWNHAILGLVADKPFAILWMRRWCALCVVVNLVLQRPSSWSDKGAAAKKQKTAERRFFASWAIDKLFYDSISCVFKCSCNDYHLMFWCIFSDELTLPKSNDWTLIIKLKFWILSQKDFSISSTQQCNFDTWIKGCED